MLLLKFFVFNFGVKKLRGGGTLSGSSPLLRHCKWPDKSEMKEKVDQCSASDKGGYWGCQKTRSLRKRISRVLSKIKYLFYWSFYFFYFNLFHFTFILKSPIGTNKDVHILMDYHYWETDLLSNDTHCGTSTVFHFRYSSLIDHTYSIIRKQQGTSKISAQ